MTRHSNPPDPPGEKAGLRGGLLSGVFLVVVVIGVVVAWLLPKEETAAASVGEPAPPISFVTFEGGDFDSADHFRRGRGPILLNLWASWCEPCLREFPVLSEFARANPGVTVVAVAVQDREEAAREFVDELQPAFVTGWDGDGSIRDAYPTFGLPATFVIDSRGVISDIVLAELSPERLESLDLGA